MSKNKTKIVAAILLIFAILIPISWFCLAHFTINKPDFSRDVYLDKSSIEIIGENNVSIEFNLKNNSSHDYGGKFLHICPVKKGEHGGLYIDYDLNFIGASQTLHIVLQTNLSKEDFEDIKIEVKDDAKNGLYTSLSESPSQSRTSNIIYFVGWGIVIIFSVLMLDKAIVLQVSNNETKEVTKDKR